MNSTFFLVRDFAVFVSLFFFGDFEVAKIIISVLIEMLI
jgi:hypothetical protein